LLGTQAPYFLPVWPKGFTAERDESGAVVVRNDKGQIIAIEGEPFDMGGGMTAEFSPADKVDPRSEQLQSLTDWLGYEIPERCLGPEVDGVWVVGETHPLLSPGPPIPGIEVTPRPSGSGTSSQTVPDETHLSAYLVQSGLLDRVMTMAAANEVPQPESIQAVVTTHNQVAAMTNKVPAAGNVVFVQVTGSFVCHTCKQLTDTPITGSAMYVEAKLGSGGIIGWGILPNPMDLDGIGVTPVDIPVPG